MKALKYFVLFLGVCSSAYGQILSPILMGSGAVPTIPFLHESSALCTGSPTTCAVTLSAAIAANNSLIICDVSQWSHLIASIDVGGTVQQTGVAQLQQTGSWGWMTCGMVLGTTATAGPVTVTAGNTFSTNGMGDVHVYIWEYPGILSLDATTDASSASAATPYTASVPTLTGSVDTFVQAVYGGSANASSVAAPWADGVFIGGSANIKTPGIADHANITQAGNTAGVWTLAAGAGIGDAGVALGYSPTPCSNAWLMDSHSGTNGVAPLAADLNSSTFGANGIGAGVDNAKWGVTNTGSAIKYSTAAYLPLVRSYRPCKGGTYTDTSTVDLQYDTSVTGGGRFISFNTLAAADYVPLTSPSQWAAVKVATTLPQNATSNMDFFTLFTAADFVNVIISGSGSALQFKCELTGGLSCGTPLTSVNTTGVYQGVVTGGAGNALVGRPFTITGFANGGNNLTNATVTASTDMSLTFSATTITETCPTALPTGCPGQSLAALPTSPGTCATTGVGCVPICVVVSRTLASLSGTDQIDIYDASNNLLSRMSRAAQNSLYPNKVSLGESAGAGPTAGFFLNFSKPMACTLGSCPRPTACPL